jgi:EVE domain-containing protein
MPDVNAEDPMKKHWIAVASAAHVRIGRAQGFMQVCHGKGGPLRRISPGDHVAYYSPTETFGGKDRLQAFTAIGEIKPGAPYQADMGGGFRPFRRDVAWSDAAAVPIRPLLDRLALTRDNPNWGYKLRLGLFEIVGEDMKLIRHVAMSREALLLV